MKLNTVLVVNLVRISYSSRFSRIKMLSQGDDACERRLLTRNCRKLADEIIDMLMETRDYLITLLVVEKATIKIKQLDEDLRRSKRHVYETMKLIKVIDDKTKTVAEI